jgi:hypothetical protein
MPSSHVLLDQVDMALDDEHAVASAGLLLAATLAERLGIEQTTDQLVDLGDRTGAARPGRKLLTLVHAWSPAATASTTWNCRLRVDRQRARPPGDGRLHGRDLAARFTFGDVRQLDRLTGRSLAGPGRPVPAPGTGRWSLTWTPPSARCTATTSRAPATATPTGSASTSRCAALAGAASSVSRMGHLAENLHWAGLTEQANTRTRADLQRSVRVRLADTSPDPGVASGASS